MLFDRPYQPIELVLPTAVDLLVVVAVGYGLVLLAFVAGLLVFLPEVRQVRAAERQAEVECAETAEMPAGDRTIVMQIPAPRRPVDEPTRVLDTRW